MKSRDTLGYSFSAIRLRKLRSGLTTLGIVIGIAAIVALLSFTQGFQVTMTAQFQEGFATDTLVVSAGGAFGGFPGSPPAGPRTTAGQSVRGATARARALAHILVGRRLRGAWLR